MLEELRKPLDGDQLKAYLRRIGLDETPKKPSTDYLDEIIRAQLRHIPFDCASVWAEGVVPSLAVDDLFDKIITRKRGGYCFELNGLFCRFLKDLGFDCYLVLVHLGRPTIIYPDINYPTHCAVIVNIDGTQRFADVGYGGPVPDGSVPLDGSEVLNHKQGMHGPYTVVFSKNADGSWFDRFTFKNMPCDPSEIVPVNFHTSQREGSVFRADLKLNLRADDGFFEVGDRLFKAKVNGETIEQKIETEEDAKEIALKYFGIPNLPTRPF